MDARMGEFLPDDGNRHRYPGNCIRWTVPVHPRAMELTEDRLDLVTAARSRQPGALRELALILDEQLADEDSSLDGAVAAWQVVRAPRTLLGTLWARVWAELRARRPGDSQCSSPEVPARAQQTYQHLDTALDQRPAA